MLSVGTSEFLGAAARGSSRSCPVLSVGLLSWGCGGLKNALTGLKTLSLPLPIPFPALNVLLNKICAIDFAMWARLHLTLGRDIFE